MAGVPLAIPPDDHDRYGRPWYRSAASLESWLHQTNDLIGNAIAEGYVRAVGLRVYRLVRDEVRRATGGRPIALLEIGGGDGFFFGLMNDVVDAYVNIEPADVALSGAALDRLEDPRFLTIRCSAELLPLPDACVDAAVAVASLDHVPDVGRALAEVRRCLRPGGVFVAQLNNSRSWWKVLLTGTELLRRRQEAIAREHHMQWSFAELRAKVARELHVERAYTVTYVPYLPRAWRLLLPIADRLGPVLLPARGANSIVVATKPT